MCPCLDMHDDMCATSHAQRSQMHYNSYKLSFPMGMVNRYTISEVPIDKSTVAMQKIVLVAISSSRAQEYLLAQSECDQDEPQLEQYLLMHQILPPLLHGLKMASEGHSHCLTNKEDRSKRHNVTSDTTLDSTRKKKQFSTEYLMISLSLKIQADSKGGKANPSICAERQSINP